MPFAAFGAARLILASAIIFITAQIDTAAISRGFIDLFITGRIPMTDTTISFEAFFGTIILVAWLALTHRFTQSAIGRISDDLRPVPIDLGAH